MDASAAGLLRRLAPLAMLLLFAACATPPTDPDALTDYQQKNDPLEPTNRVLYSINNGVDSAVLRPAAMAYHALPQPVRNGVHNVLTNLHAPVQLGNDMLEGKPRRAGDTLMRLLINTTVGLGGILDVASDWGYPDHNADFGLTLALWGIPEGPYLFVPLIGPSNFRDIGGYGIDVAADPLTWIGQGTAVTALRWSRVAVRGIDTRERLDSTIEDVKRNSLDPYATFRSGYRQSRAALVEEIRNDDRATVPAWFAQPGKP
jgi:phospholipid-binding lipoprotein MlaA